MNIKSLKLLMAFALIMVLSTACIWNEEVQPNEIGLVVIAGEIDRCEGPGLVNDGSWWSDLERIKRDTLTFSFGNASVATKDTQIVSVGVTVQVKRKPDCESATAFLTTWPQLVNDTNLQEAVSATGSEAIKNGVRQYTLTQLLDDRDGLSNAILTALQQDADKYYTEIVSVIVNDVDVDDEYEQLLSDKAKLTVQIETEQRRQDLVRAAAQANIIEQQQQVEVLKAQLEKEKAQTAIQVEISSRESKAVAAAWEIYLSNPDAMTLKRLELYQGIFGGPSTKWVFLPKGEAIDTILTDELIPVIPGVAP